MRLALCMILAGLALFGQTDRGTITGTITDPAGAVVASAPVEAKNADTGQVFPVVSTATGNFTVPQLPPGPYELSVSLPGFKKYERKGLTLSPTQIMRIDIALEVGSSTESVTVTAEATLLKTESGELAHNVTVSQMQNLPILAVGGNGGTATSGFRDPFALALLIPGVQYIANSQMIVNGTPDDTIQIRVEGQTASDTGGGRQYTGRSQPSVDAIQEVAVQTSNFAAEFGAVGGGIFNVTMKSGTNQYHGSAYDYAVNEILNAHQPYTGLRNAQKRHDYGGTLGGPVQIPKLYNGQNKTFFFWGFEQFRENLLVSVPPAVLGVPTPPTVPIPAYRNGDFSQVIIGSGVNGAPRNVQVGGADYRDPLGRLTPSGTIFDPRTERTVTANGQSFLVRDPFPGNRIDPTRFDKVALNIQKLLPLPQGPTANQLGQNYQNSWVSHRTSEIPSLKIDQSVGDKGKLSFYWSTTGTESQYSSPNGNMEGFPTPITVARGTFIHNKTIRLNYDHTLSPTLLLHLGAGYSSEDFDDHSPSLGYDALKELGLKGATVNRQFPQFVALGTTIATGGMSSIGVSIQGTSAEQRPSGNTSLTWVRSNHTYKLGAEWRQEGYISKSFSNVAGSYTIAAPIGQQQSTAQTALQGITTSQGSTGFGYANFLLGQVNNVTLSVPTALKTGKSQWGLFLQDTWKATRKLTLDYGVRWDYGGYAREQYGRSGNFSPTVPNPSAAGRLGGTIYEATCNCNFVPNYPYAVGPRLGIAYQINSKTVVRGGFGIVYTSTGTTSGSSTNSATSGTPGYAQWAFQLQDGVPANVAPKWPAFDPGVNPTPGTVSGSPSTYLDPNATRPARQAQWSVGIQREISRNLVVEASYVANRGVWWPITSTTSYLSSINDVSESLLAAYGFKVGNLDDGRLLTTNLANLTAAQRATLIARGINPSGPYAGYPLTQTVRQSIRPYPQFSTGIAPQQAPLGKTWYDALQTTVTKRFSRGLSLNANYTWSKALDLMSSPDVFNRGMGKDLTTNDLPHQLRLSAQYVVPKIRAGSGILSNKFLQFALADWGVGWYMSYQSALTLNRPTNTTANPISNWLGRGPGSAQLIDGQSLWSTDWVDNDGKRRTDPIDINCHCYDPTKTIVLNRNAWANIPDVQWGAQQTTIRQFRGIRMPQENINFSRDFRVKERVRFQIRAEFTNAFNRLRLPQPTVGSFTSQATQVNGIYTGGFGTITPSGGTANSRTGLLIARIQF